jgi:hypothetical protein
MSYPDTPAEAQAGGDVGRPYDAGRSQPKETSR